MASHRKTNDFGNSCYNDGEACVDFSFGYPTASNAAVMGGKAAATMSAGDGADP